MMQVTMEPMDEANSPNGFNQPITAEIKPDPMPMDPSRISWGWLVIVVRL